MILITFVILLTFFLSRNSFTIIKGKRSIKNVTAFIYWGRKLIEVIISFLIPILLLLEIMKTVVYTPFYYFGALLSIFGLLLMIWTRIDRGKDWGFMGDGPGDSLFANGPYKLSRHPYYVGAIFVGIGLYLQLNYFLVILMVPVIFFITHVILKEDTFLESKFGAKYMEYKNKVGIFPWFY